MCILDFIIAVGYGIKSILDASVAYLAFVLAGLIVAWFVMAMWPCLKSEFRRIGRKWHGAGRKARFIWIVAVISLVALGSFKFDYGQNGVSPNLNSPASLFFNPRPLMLTGLQLPVIPDWAVEYGRWSTRGGYEDFFVAQFTNGFNYVWGTNQLDKVKVFADGHVSGLGESWKIPVTTNVISAIPGVSGFWHGYDGDCEKYIFTWQQFGLDRGTNDLVDAQVELYNPWRCRTVCGGEEHFYVYGQLADGVQDGQPSGYEEWVDSQVGTDEANGLYKFSFSTPSFGAQDALIEVGTNRVLVAGGETYSFLLEKGCDYALKSYPFTGTWSVCEAVDDIATASNGPMLMSTGNFGSASWTIGGGLNLELPTMFSDGHCNWLPTLKGSPDIGYYDANGSSIEFSALLTDYSGNGPVSFLWEASDDNLHFLSPTSQTSILTFSDAPTWREAEISVTATIGTNEICSILSNFAYGTQEVPQGTNGIEAISIRSDAGSSVGWNDVILAGESLRVAIELGIACDTVEDFVSSYDGDINLTSYGYTSNSVVALASEAVPLSPTNVVKNSKYSYVVSVDAQWLQDNSLVSKAEEYVDELTSIDISASDSGSSQRTDSDAIDGLQQYEKRGRVRGGGNEQAVPPEGGFGLKALQAAGTVVLEASSGGVCSQRVQAQQQADVVYYSGHGTHKTGKLMGQYGPLDLVDYWEDVDVVVIAGCAVLDINNYRSSCFNLHTQIGRWMYAGGSNSPGQSWEELSPKVYLGYAWKAPLDNNGGNAIAQNFVTNLNAGQDWIVAWENANDCNDGRNACAIDCRDTPHVFWYWHEENGSCTWTSVQKGATGWE